MRKRRAIVYGMERFLKYEQPILEQYEVACILDPAEKYQGKFYRGIPVFDFRCLIAAVYDCVLLVEGRDNSGELIHSYGVPWDKIFIFVNERGNEWEDVVLTVEGTKIKARFDTTQFFLRNQTDFWVMHEIFCRDEYSFSIQDAPCIVFDVGMNVGLATLYFAQKDNVERVYSFEPFPATYAQALENFSLNCETIGSKIQAFNFGLSDYDGEETFSYMPDYPGNARTVHEGGETNPGAERFDVDVKIKDAGRILRPFFEKHKDKLIVMKIDCEGAEYAIFSSLDREGILHWPTIFMMETHMGKEQLLKNHLKYKGYAFFSPYMGGQGKNGMLYAVKIKE